MNRRHAPILALLLLLLLAGVVAWRSFGNPAPRAPAVSLEPAPDKLPEKPPGPENRNERAAAAPGAPGKEATRAAALAAAKAETPTPVDADHEKTPVRESAAEAKPATVFMAGDEKTGEARLTMWLRVTVIDELGRPVPDAQIIASAYGMADVGEIPEGMTVSPAREHYPDTVLGRSDASGKLEIEIGFRAPFPDFAYMDVELHAATAMAKSPKVEVLWKEKQAAYDVTLTLPQRGGLRGRVVDAAGVGIDQIGIYPSWKDQPKDDWRYTFTDVSGYFEIGNLPPGEVTLAVRGDFYRPIKANVTAQVYANVVTGLDADIVVEPITRYALKLSPPEGGRNVPLSAVYFGPDGVLKTIETVWFNDYHVYLFDPPEGAVAVELFGKGYSSLRIALPGIKRCEVRDLGESRMINSPPHEKDE